MRDKDVNELKLALSDLLDELRYVHETHDVRDSIKNSDAIRDKCAKLLGFETYEAFVAESKRD